MEKKEDIKQKDMQHYFLQQFISEYYIKKFQNPKGILKTDIRKLEPIFHSFKLNNRIFKKVTDVIVTKFLDDTVVDDEIELANTKHNFFLSTCLE